MFGKSRRIQNDQVVIASHLFQVFECIFGKCLVTRIAGEIQLYVLIGQRDRFRRTIHRVNNFGSSAHSIKGKTTGITEHIQYGMAFRILFQ